MIYTFLAQGFEETEAICTIDIMRRAGIETVTVGVGGREITSARGIKVLADIADSEVETNNMTGIFLPGGMPGAEKLEKSPIVTAAVNYCINNDLYMFAICAAPYVLGKLGALKGKKAVCFPGFEKQLYGAEFTDKPAVTDGKIITGKGMGSVLEFGLEIAALLKGEEKSKSIRSAIQM